MYLYVSIYMYLEVSIYVYVKQQRHRSSCLWSTIVQISEAKIYSISGLGAGMTMFSVKLFRVRIWVRGRARNGHTVCFLYRKNMQFINDVAWNIRLNTLCNLHTVYMASIMWSKVGLNEKKRLCRECLSFLHYKTFL